MLLNNQRLAEIAGVNYDTEKIRRYPIVYSRTHTILRQFPMLATYPKCVLITSFSDNCVTPQLAKRLPPNVIRWYSNNVNDDVKDERIIAVPIGFVFNQERERYLLAAERKDKDQLLYLNFTRWPAPRQGLYEMFGGHSWVTARGGAAFDSVPAPEFYSDLSRHYYILSPPGAGPDCHRHWESIYMGSVPIVLRHQASILEGCPHLAVDSWDQVTEDLLRQDHQFPSYNCDDKMTIEYWRTRIEGELID